MRGFSDGSHTSARPEYIIDNQCRAAADLKRDDEFTAKEHRAFHRTKRLSLGPELSWGYANTTPWHSYREQNEQQLAAAYAAMADKLEHPERAVFNLHAPPYSTQLDDAPAIDDDFKVQVALGQVQYKPVGSTAVREIEAERQPLVGLHGHIHESAGVRRLGRRKSLILNPGSAYSVGALHGALVSLHKDRADAQLVRG